MPDFSDQREAPLSVKGATGRGEEDHFSSFIWFDAGHCIQNIFEIGLLLLFSREWLLGRTSLSPAAWSHRMM
jgi:hypothetical protein